MKDVKCPYCGAMVEINHDDGYGYSEDNIHNQECKECGKTFAYTTHVSYSYDAHKADCLNGAEHNYKPTKIFPKIFTEMECESCGDRREATLEEWRNILSKEEIAQLQSRYPSSHWIHIL
jgi:hypothetical protein